MPLYQFAVYDGTDGALEATADCIDDRAARIEGARLMSEMLRDEPLAACDGLELSVIVTDTAGSVLCSIKTTSAS